MNMHNVMIKMWCVGRVKNSNLTWRWLSQSLRDGSLRLCRYHRRRDHITRRLHFESSRRDDELWGMVAVDMTREVEGWLKEAISHGHGGRVVLVRVAFSF